MLWPLVLPFQITTLLLMALVGLSTSLAPLVKWRRGRVFGVSLAFGCLAFIPTCLGIMAILDSQRFGTFQYHSASEVKDFRVERYLPTDARNIVLNKVASGYRAKYSISKADLLSYLNTLWKKYGRRSAIPRDRLRDGAPVPVDYLSHVFVDLKWPVLKNPVEFHSPTERDGGGATYYFDAATDTVYQRASYW